MKEAARWFVNLFGSKGSETAMAFRRVFNTHDGQLVIKSLFQYCNGPGTSFVAGDPYQTSFNEGQRDVFNHIMGASHLKPEDFITTKETHSG